MSNYWDERFGGEEYVYGEDPNVFFAEKLSNLNPGKIILPCEGEGRNAVYAAVLGWKVHAFDNSTAGKTKAVALANKKVASINYDISDAMHAAYPENGADIVAFIFAHFPPEIRTAIHQKAIKWLKPGGIMLLEAFNPNQLGNLSGGPQDITMLYTTEMLRTDFEELDIKLLEKKQIELKEGRHHDGNAEVVRFIGIKT